METEIQFDVTGFDPAVAEMLRNAFNTSQEPLPLPVEQNSIRTWFDGDELVVSEHPLYQNPISQATEDVATLDAIVQEKPKKKRATKKVEEVAAPVIPEVQIETKNIFSDFMKQEVYPLFKSDATLDDMEIDWNHKVGVKFEKDSLVEVVVVGCGGNGSRVVNLLAQQMYSNKNITKLTLYDNDTVETKNLTRQLFYEFEVGENKAVALADRYKMLYGINIEARNTKFHRTEIRFVHRNNRPTNLVIFDCVDNKGGRVECEKYLELYSAKIHDSSSYSSVSIISCGNQKDYGQVHFGYCDKESSLYNNTPLSYSSLNDLKFSREIIRRMNGANLKCIKSFIDEKTSYITPFLAFNKTFEDSKESVSCADMDIVEEQSMAINCTVSQLAFNIFFQMLYDNDGVKNGMIFTNLSNDFSVQSIQSTESLFDYYLKSIFGKNIFFERDKCHDQFIKALKITKTVFNKHQKIMETFTQNNLLSDILYVDLDKIKSSLSYKEDILNIIVKYIESTVSDFKSFIDENFSSEYELHYLDYQLSLFFFSIYLNYFTRNIHSALNYKCSSNIAYYFEYYAIGKIEYYLCNLHDEFLNIYKEIESKSNYEYFVK